MTKFLLVVVLSLAAAALAGCTTAPQDADPAPSTEAGAAPAPDRPAGDAAATQDPTASRPGARPSASSPPTTASAAAPTWASLDSAAIHPGIQTFTDGAQCTANFVFWQANGTGYDLFIGQAAHCAGTGAATDTNGCTADSLPLGTKVDLGTGHDGVLAYSSWLAMQAAKTSADAAECYGNDFALVRIAESDESAVSPEVPFFGGPVALAAVGDLSSGDEVYSYGNSELRLGVEPGLSWKHGTVLDSTDWIADVYTASPGIPGDSGSGFLTADGGAWGVLSTVAVAPLPASNQVAGLAPAVGYAASHGGPVVELGTAPWTGSIV